MNLNGTNPDLKIKAIRESYIGVSAKNISERREQETINNNKQQ